MILNPFRWDTEVAAAGSGSADPKLSQQLRFLELENFDSDTTMLTMPPDAADLPKGSVYQYEKFENLNSDLFKRKTAPTSTTAAAAATPTNNKGRLYFCALFAWFLRPVLAFGNLLFIHASTIAADDQKKFPFPLQTLPFLEFWYH